MPFSHGGGVDGGPMGQEAASQPCKLVLTQNMKVVGHLALTMTLLRVSHQYMTHERMLAGIVVGNV